MLFLPARYHTRRKSLSIKPKLFRNIQLVYYIPRLKTRERVKVVQELRGAAIYLLMVAQQHQRCIRRNNIQPRTYSSRAVPGMVVFPQAQKRVLRGLFR